MNKNIRKNVKTSYSLPLHSYWNLKREAELLGISVQNLLKRVMARYVKKIHRNLMTGDNVIEYNKHGENGFKKIYIRWEAKEYCIVQQLRFNTRYSTSLFLAKAVEECLSVIVMALTRKKIRKGFLEKKFFQNQMLRLERFFVFWPNIEVNPKILPFFEMHLDYVFY